LRQGFLLVQGKGAPFPQVLQVNVVLSMWSCKLKLDEEKWKCAGLAQQNGFGPAYLYSLLRPVRGTAKPNTC
jgi:hypothetical protein